MIAEPSVEKEEKINVIIIEDSEDDCELTEFALMQASDNIHFRHFADGVEALNFIFAKKKFEGDKVQSGLKFVLLDIGLPTINGLDLLRKIREEKATKALPVIILTSSKEDKDMNAAYALGANSYVVKPNGYDSYVDKIKSLAFYWSCVNQKPY